MFALMNELTDMPDWQRQIFDPEFTFKWKSAKVMSGKDITKAMADWCVEEVKFYVANFHPSKMIPSIDGGVIKSDSVIPKVLHDEFQKATSILRGVSRSSSDPAEILDVVDPFLYPFSWEHTKTLHFERPLTLSNCVRRSGEGQLARQPMESECPVEERSRYPNNRAFSRRFQFLPFEISFGDGGEGRPRITSYINNIHPMKHQSFYHTLESFIDRTIPSLNRTIMAIKAPSYENVRLHVAVLGRDPMIKKDVDHFRPPQQRAIIDFVDDHGRYRDWLLVDLKKEFWNIGLQFVLHIQELTFHSNTPTTSDSNQSDPMAPTNKNWQVAGQRNERICATTLYVSQTTNLLHPPQLSFRRRIHDEEAGLARGYITTPPFAPAIYGAQTGDPTIQEMGDIALHDNRCITYPNIFQTRLLPPTSFTDPTKPAHITLTSLHLIDPNRRMMSSAMVPPQRRDWWAEEVRRLNSVFWRLPIEVWDRIVELVDEDGRLMGDGRAREVRREFVDERRVFQEKHTAAMEDFLEWDLENYDEDDE